MKRFFRGSVLFLFLLLCSMQTAAANSIRVFLDGQAVAFPAAPFIENDRVLVPLRGILESLGYTVHWQEQTQTVLAVQENVSISLRINQNTATVNGKTVKLDTPAKITNDRTFVPLRFLAEYSGAAVTWDGETSSVFIASSAMSTEQQMKQSVVYIQTNKMQGSGIVLSADGLIATNYHVLQGASTAQFLFADGSIYQGETTVVGLNPDADIALLRIARTNLHPASPALSGSVGEAVTAIGSPGGQRNVITTGVIKGFDEDVISATAVIAQGSSGGGLFNSKGQLLGMTSFYGDGQYFSIPTAKILQVPQTLSLPLRDMKYYIYTPSAPQNLRVHTETNGYAYVLWSSVYRAEYYYVYQSTSPNGKFVRIQNRTGEKWYWGYPYCFGVAVSDGTSAYIKVSAVVDGQETPLSEAIRISP